MHSIESNTLKVSIDPQGAELQTIVHKDYDLEYLWDGNPSFWSKRSPVLFPIVGALKNDTYHFKGSAYQLPRHGFGRNQLFKIEESSPDGVSFYIEDSPETLLVFPFRFKFFIHYRLAGNKLEVTYKVENSDPGTIYFSLGGHPAFKIPLVDGTVYEDYQISFEEEEDLYRWPVTGEGLIDTKPVLLNAGTKILPLSKALFKDDALVLKNLRSKRLELHSDKTSHGLSFDFSGFPYLGLWASPGADFLCIEPWCGIADSVDASGELMEKEGIIALPPATVFERTWTASFY